MSPSLSQGRPTLPPGMQIFERGWLSSNNVLLQDAQTSILIDSGYVLHAQQTLALVQHALQGRSLQRIFNTHLHSDHCGGNALLQSHYACPTFIPAAEAEKVSNWAEDQLSYLATGQTCPRFSFDGVLQAGDRFEVANLEWQVLAAPGHDPHSLIFYAPTEQILISADALWERGFGVIFPELEGESGFAEAQATLELIASLDIRLVIPGHGAVFTDCQAALERAFTRLDYLRADPERNAMHALKVLLKFILLEKQKIVLAELPSLLAQIPLFVRVNQRFLQKDPLEMAHCVAQQLHWGGVAQVRDGVLWNKD